MRRLKNHWNRLKHTLDTENKLIWIENCCSSMNGKIKLNAGRLHENKKGFDLTHF